MIKKENNIKKIDMLEQLFDKQIILQKKFKNIPFKQQKDRQEFINLNLLACLDELSESMRETAWKNPNYIKHGWKKEQKFNNEKFKEELIDLWHFIINLSLAANLNPEELYRRFCNKNKINHERQKNGY